MQNVLQGGRAGGEILACARIANLLAGQETASLGLDTLRYSSVARRDNIKGVCNKAVRDSFPIP